MAAGAPAGQQRLALFGCPLHRRGLDVAVAADVVRQAGELDGDGQALGAEFADELADVGLELGGRR